MKSKTLEEQLREEVKELKATVRSLQKALKKLNKGKERVEDLEELVKELSYATPVAPKSNRCSACSEGAIKKSDLGIKYLFTCTVCKYRRVEKK